jgi:hypothetical protein
MSIKLVIVHTRQSENTPWFDEIAGNVEKLTEVASTLAATPGFIGQTIELTPLKRTKTIEFADDVALRNYVMSNEQNIQHRGSVVESYLQEHGCTEDIYLA